MPVVIFSYCFYVLRYQELNEMTAPSNSSFFKGFAVLFLLISGLVFLLQYLESPLLYPEIWTIQIFFLFITALGHLISAKGLTQKRDFHIFYMLSMGVRLFCCIIFVIIIIYTSSGNLVLFVANFFTLYLVYTSFEIYFLLRNLRADLKSDE